MCQPQVWASSADPDQTAKGAVWSGSTLFAILCASFDTSSEKKCNECNTVVAVYNTDKIWATSWQNQQNNLCAQRRLRSAQADQNLRWMQRSFCWFCHEECGSKQWSRDDCRQNPSCEELTSITLLTVYAIDEIYCFCDVLASYWSLLNVKAKQ